MFWIDPNILPPELREALEKQVDHNRMVYADTFHSFNQLFEDMSLDQLRSLGTMFHLMSKDPTGSLAAYYEGVTATYVTVKHKHCLACDKIHDPDIEFAESRASEQTKKAQQDDTNLLDKYRVVRVEIDGKKKIFCTGCSLEYVSLADRMLKPPAECHGCEHKMKWG